MVSHLFTQKLISAQMRIFNQTVSPSVSAVPKSQNFFLLTELEAEDPGIGGYSLSKKLLSKGVGGSGHLVQMR